MLLFPAPPPMIPTTLAAPATRFDIPSLDGFRALSIGVVLLAHSGYGHLVPGGLGVTIFFFLSGFLITTLMLREAAATGSFAVPAFYGRRLVRLYPPLLAAIFVAWLGTLAGLVPGGYTVSGLVAHLFYVANYYVLQGGGSIPDGTFSLWSLAVEEHFYILYPLAFLVLVPLVETRKPALLLVLLCLVALGWRAIWMLAGGDAGHIEFATDTRFDSLLFGCLLAFLMRSFSIDHARRQLSRRQSIVLASALLLLIASLEIRVPFFRSTLRYTVQGIALMPIFFIAVRCPNAGVFRLFNGRLVRRIGVLSYSIYLIHHVLLAAVSRSPLGGHSAFLNFVLIAVLSYGWAVLIDRFLEQPVRRLRTRRRVALQPTLV